MSSNLNEHYQRVDRALRGVLDELQPILSAEECGEVELFLEAGEYGVALETLVEILREQGRPISSIVSAGLRNAAALMGVNYDPFLLDGA